MFIYTTKDMFLKFHFSQLRMVLETQKSEILDANIPISVNWEQMYILIPFFSPFPLQKVNRLLSFVSVQFFKSD